MKNSSLLPLLLLLLMPRFLLGQQADTLCIDNVQIIPMTANTVLKQQRVWAAGGKFIAIESAQEPVSQSQCSWYSISSTTVWTTPALPTTRPTV